MFIVYINLPIPFYELFFWIKNKRKGLDDKFSFTKKLLTCPGKVLTILGIVPSPLSPREIIFGKLYLSKPQKLLGISFKHLIKLKVKDRLIFP